MSSGPSSVHLSLTNLDESNSQHQHSANRSGSRKRTRIPISCTVCRRKKLKCDKSQPCFNCITRHTSSSCSYAWQNTALDSQPDKTAPAQPSLGTIRQSSSVTSYERSSKIPLNFTLDKRISAMDTSSGPARDTMHDQVIELKRRLSRMESVLASMKNDITPASVSTPAAAEDNPFGLRGLSSQNIQLLLTTGKPELEIKKNRMTYFGPLSSIATVTQDPYVQYLISRMDPSTQQKFRQVHADFIRAAAESLSHPLQSQKAVDNSRSAEKARIQKTDIMTQRLSEQMYNVNAECSEMFPRLSDRHVCEYLIDQFMQTANKMFPLLNPSELRSQVMAFWEIKQETSEAVFWDNGAKRKRFLRLTALITMVVRIGWLVSGKEWKPVQSGLGNPDPTLFGRHLEQYAWSCLRGTNYIAKSDITTLQVLLLFRLHISITPEVGDAVDLADSAGLIGLLSQSAITIGLHRDPDLFRRVSSGMTRTWRLLWSEIVFQDTDRALDLSIPFSIQLELSDTDLEKLLPFADDITAIEKPSLTFLHSKVKWCILSRSILSRLMQPNLVLSREEFNNYYQQLAAFEDSYLSSFHMLLQMFHADSSASVSGPQDSYDLTQKFFLQVQFLRLRLVLLKAYSPRRKEDQKLVRKLKTGCALTILDTLATCLRCPQLFPRFMWLVVPLALRHYHYAIVLVGSDIIRISLDSPESVSRQPLGIADGSWKTPDLSYRYTDEDLVDLRRLYQAYMRTYELIKSYSDEYYGAYKSAMLLSLFNRCIKDQLTSASPSSAISTPSYRNPIATLQSENTANWDSLFSEFDSLDSPDWWNDWSAGLSLDQMVD
ncbi:hypothetical protein V1508DRAFT_284852 [Lipomyces doorenjongii]|uniref:uncharacterized protein n=1 Tax=Lipomyces doorenjongii TaxID=383834 RepID=UPI0034CFC358